MMGGEMCLEWGYMLVGVGTLVSDTHAIENGSSCASLSQIHVS